MPMSFPNMDSLKRAADCHNFRMPNEKEQESEYRKALADHVEETDFIESCEIRNKVGWDQFTSKQNMDMLNRQIKKSGS